MASVRGCPERIHYKKGDRAVARLSSEPSSRVYFKCCRWCGVDWGKFSQAVNLGWTARGVSGNVPNLITLLWDLGSRGPVVGFDRAVGFRVERKRSLIIAVG